MKVNDVIIIEMLNHIGIWLYRVTNDSKNAAAINTGTSPNAIFTPCLAPRTNDTPLEYVPGNKILFPIVSPAHPAITIAEISNVP